MLNTILSIKSNTNSPFFSTLTVIEETEKAIKVQNDIYKSKIGWIPKKALVPVCTVKNAETFTFAMWFRKADNGQAITKAFRLLD